MRTLHQANSKQSAIAVGREIGFVDYSRKEADDFGNYTIIKRAYSNTIDVDVQLRTAQIPTIQRLRSELRSTPVVWVASEKYTETAFGFLALSTLTSATRFYPPQRHY